MGHLWRRERRQWKTFRLEAFGTPFMVYHDGPAFDDVRAHWRADPTYVEQMLHAGLDERDPLAATTIRELSRSEGRLGHDFVPELNEVLPSAKANFGIEVALALICLTGDQDPAEAIVGILQTDGSEFVRLDAAMALASVQPTTLVVDALAAGVTDPEYLVRYHSANSLLSLSGAGFTLDTSESLFGRISSESNPDRWHEASDELRRRFPEQ